MAYKDREKPFRLLVMESLVNRMELPKEEHKKYANWVKGFHGELQVDAITARLKCDCLVLNDLYLAVNGKSFQVDALIVTAKGLYLYEVKNFEGEYYYENERIYYGPTKKEVYDPLYQIRHAESLMRQLVDKMGYNLPVKKFIVFVNPNFTLFQAPRDSGIILPGMLESHFSMMDRLPGKLNESHHRFAAEIKARHMEDCSLNYVPEYKESQLKKGVTCVQCGAFIEEVTIEWSCICKHCGQKERLDQTILRHAQEYRRLFPEQKITTTTIRKWCGDCISTRRIQYILSRHFNAIGSRRWCYYE